MCMPRMKWCRTVPQRFVVGACKRRLACSGWRRAWQSTARKGHTVHTLVADCQHCGVTVLAACCHFDYESLASVCCPADGHCPQTMVHGTQERGLATQIRRVAGRVCHASNNNRAAHAPAGFLGDDLSCWSQCGRRVLHVSAPRRCCVFAFRNVVLQATHAHRSPVPVRWVAIQRDGFTHDAQGTTHNTVEWFAVGWC